MIRRGWMATMVCLVAGLAIAATQKSDVEGRWQATQNTANGPITLTYNFQAKGEVLTGTEESPMFSRSISEGKVHVDKISFKTTINGHSIEHRGTVNGDRIQLRNFGPRGEFDLTLKRAPSEKKPSQQ